MIHFKMEILKYLILQKASPLSPFHPEDDEEIFPPKTKPMKDYSREPLSGKAKVCVVCVK